MILEKTQETSRFDLSFPFDLPSYMKLTVSHRQDSAYMMEASGANEGEETPIDTCDLFIQRISSVDVWDTKLERYVTKKIRYVKGCETIWVDEQKAQNLEIINPAASAIFLSMGSLGFSVEGDNVQKAMFLMLHENNASFVEVPKKFRRPPAAADRFFVIEDEIKAEKVVAGFFAYELEAKKYLSQLIVSAGGEIRYHEDRLSFLCELMEIGAVESGSSHEKFELLLGKVNEDPKRFMLKVGDYESVVEGDVKKAIATAVIEVSETSASFSGSGKLIVAFDKVRMSQSEKIKDIIDYFLNPRNLREYEHLRSQTTLGLKTQTQIIEE